MANTLNFGAGKWAAKEGSVLAYNSENNNFKPLPFTFTRASTATRVNESGLIESVASGVPRIDFLDNADGHLLLEPSRTNTFLYSEDLSNAAWVKERISVSSDVAVAPDGTNTADKIVENTDNNSHRARQNANSTQGVAYAFSCYLKASERTKARLSAGGLNASADFDLSNGSVIGTPTLCTASIKNVGNGWYLCAIAYTQTATTSASQLHLVATLNDAGDFSYTGDGTSGLYLWGAQLELGSYATSYIPTSGSSVTRAAEVCNNAGNTQVFNDSEGVLFLDIATDNDLSGKRIAISDGTTDEVIEIRTDSTSNRFKYSVFSGGSTEVNVNYDGGTISNFNKIALKYKTNDFAIWVNGVEVGTDASGSTPTGLDRLNFDRGNGTINFYGRIKSVQVYNTALTDSELAALTS